MTTMDLAVPDGQDVATNDAIERYCHEMEDVAIWVADVVAPMEAAEVVERARTFRQWAKIRKQSSIVARAAARLESVALRRIAQLGGLEICGVRGPNRGAARYFAVLSDEEFYRHIDNSEYMSPVALWRLMKPTNGPTREAREQRARGDRKLATKIWKEAAKKVVDDLQKRSTTFTTAEAATEMAEELDLYDRSSLVDLALERAVHGAYREEGRKDGLPVGVPVFLSFRESGSRYERRENGRWNSGVDEWPRCGRWLQVPTKVATVEQARWAILHRKEQLKVLTETLACLEREYARAVKRNAPDSAKFWQSFADAEGFRESPHP